MDLGQFMSRMEGVLNHKPELRQIVTLLQEGFPPSIQKLMGDQRPTSVASVELPRIRKVPPRITDIAMKLPQRGTLSEREWRSSTIVCVETDTSGWEALEQNNKTSYRLENPDENVGQRRSVLVDAILYRNEHQKGEEGTQRRLKMADRELIHTLFNRHYDTPTGTDGQPAKGLIQGQALLDAVRYALMQLACCQELGVRDFEQLYERDEIDMIQAPLQKSKTLDDIVNILSIAIESHRVLYPQSLREQKDRKVAFTHRALRDLENALRDRPNIQAVFDQYLNTYVLINMPSKLIDEMQRQPGGVPPATLRRYEFWMNKNDDITLGDLLSELRRNRPILNGERQQGEADLPPSHSRKETKAMAFACGEDPATNRDDRKSEAVAATAAGDIRSTRPFGI